ncbi:MAG: phosphatase PAP2 family protein [Solirubrobacteraceae bacterium]
MRSGAQSFDERLLRVARTRGHGDPRVERAVARFSRLGEHGGVWLAIGAAGWALDRPRAAQWQGATARVAGVYALNTLLKLAVRRRRPELPGLPALTGTPTQLSFPSAHAATSFAAARLYARLGLPAPVLYALAIKMSLSRLYLGVHYPSDVLAGAALGTVAAGRWEARGSRGAGSREVSPITSRKPGEQDTGAGS